MGINRETLERLSNLELRQYAGDLHAIIGKNRKLWTELSNAPVDVKMAASRGICEDKLYDICLSVQRKHETFSMLRHRIMEALSKKSETLGFNLLTVLFDGIYVGEPEDLFHYRNNLSGRILYPTKGLGSKLAEVTFIDEHPFNILFENFGKKI